MEKLVSKLYIERMDRIMIFDKFKTPVGVFRVYRNPPIQTFFIDISEWDTFWMQNKAFHPDGSYNKQRGLLFY